jgi:pimeloyl-ACP methyl ester carboxylesterase
MASAAPAYRIAAPVLAIGGGKDRVIPSSTVRRIAARFPRGQATFHEFPDLSHWPMDEPEAPDIAALILSWLAAQADEPRQPGSVAAIT